MVLNWVLVLQKHLKIALHWRNELLLPISFSVLCAPTHTWLEFENVQESLTNIFMGRVTFLETKIHGHGDTKIKSISWNSESFALKFLGMDLTIHTK